jgi:hypothetical protein
MLIWNACAAKIELSSASTGWVRRQTSGAFAGRPAVGVFRSAIGGRGVRVTIIRVRWGAKEKFLAGAAAFGSAPPRINRTVAARTDLKAAARGASLESQAVFSRAIVAATGACVQQSSGRGARISNDVVGAVSGRGGPRGRGGRPRLQPGPHGEEGQRELDQLSADDVRGTLPRSLSLTRPSAARGPDGRPRGYFRSPLVLSVLARCTTLYVRGLWRVQPIALI